MYAPETQAKILSLRAKVNAGQRLTLEEQRECIALIRNGRAVAAATSAAAKTRSRAKSAPVDMGSLLDGLE
jgi:hypothetical protein